MRINRENVIYLLAFIPGLLGLILQLLIGEYFHIAIRLILTVTVLMILVQMARHFARLPKARKLYGNLRQVDGLRLPETLNAAGSGSIVVSDEIDKLYEGHATADVLASLIEQDGEPRLVIMSPLLLEKHAELAGITAARAYLKHQNHSQAWNFFMIVFPFLLLVNFLLAYYVGDFGLLQQFGALLRSILMPTLAAVAAIGIMTGWSKLNLRSEQAIDRILCDFYPAKQVKASIALEEEIEGRGEKERFQQINSEDVRRRYEAIEKYQP